MRSRRPSSLMACASTSSGMPASAIFVRYSSATERVVLAELLLDRLHLLAQEVLALLLLGAGLDVLADALAHLQLGQPLALEAQGELEALGDVERLQQLDLLVEGQVGRVAGGVGERAGLGDRAHERRDAAVVAAQLEDLLDHGAVLALELAGAAVDGHRRPGAPRPRRAAGRRGRCAAAPAMPRATPESATARPPPGSRTRSVTSATVPTFANSFSWRGTSRTRSASPTSTGRVTSMVGKTTVSSRGTSSIEVMCVVTSFLLAAYE